jgi:hypothetical protein
MEFKLTINMDEGERDNGLGPAWEVAKILQALGRRIAYDNQVYGGILMDSNGNHVGHAWVEETETSSVYAKGNE